MIIFLATILILIIEYSNQICGARGLLTKPQKFDRSKEKSIENFFSDEAGKTPKVANFLDNGNLYSVWGWMKLTDNRYDHQIMSYGMKKNFPDDPLFKTASTMIGIKYLGSKSSFHIDIMESDESMINKVSIDKFKHFFTHRNFNFCNNIQF